MASKRFYHFLLVILSTLVQKHVAVSFFDMKDTALCFESCIRTKSKFFATRMPMVVSEKVFQGVSCPIYEAGLDMNCAKLFSSQEIFENDGKIYKIHTTPSSWFEAQKFCRSNGWRLGELKSEKDLQPILKTLIGSGEVWSAAHSFASKGASFAFSETNLAFSDAGAKADKNFMENGCLMLSGWNSANVIKKAESCSKKTQFLCEKVSPCTLSKEECKRQNEPKPCMISATDIPCQDCVTSVHCSDKMKKPSTTFEYTGALPFGNVQTICNKVYLLARDYLPLNLANDFCCSLGMKLVSIETKDEFRCLSNKLGSLSSKDVGSRWWTSGVKSDCSGDTVWCGSGHVYSEDELGNVGGATRTKKCIVLMKMGVNLNFGGANCSENNRPLCEGTLSPRRTYINNNCPKITCSVNMDLFKTNSEVTAVTKPPGGSMVFQANRHFFVSSSEATWSEAQETCCSLGLTLTEASDEQRRKDLYKLSISKNGKDDEQKKLLWTSGYRSQSANYFWCPRGSKVARRVEGKDGDCVSLNTQSLELISTDCNTKMHFTCEYIAMDDPTCVAGTCPYIGSPEEFKLITKLDLKALETNGKILYDTCGRHLFFSNEQVSFTQSITFCFQTGMRPIMFHTKEDMRCFVKTLMNYDGGKAGASFHMPLSDENCLGRYAWCGTGHPVKPEVFNELKPLFFDPLEVHRYCVSAMINSKESANGTSHFLKEACDVSLKSNTVSKRYICDISA